MKKSVRDASSQGRSILVAADDPTTLAVLVSSLKTAGHKVRSANSAEGVVAAMHLELPDLLVLHPGGRLSGGSLYRRLLADGRTGATPILVVAHPTAVATFNSRPRADYFLAKPVKLSALNARLEALVTAPQAIGAAA